MKKSLEICLLFYLSLLCFIIISSAAWADAPVVIIDDGPDAGETVPGPDVGFTFHATGGGSEVVPGSGPLILVAGGEPVVENNSLWPTTEHIANKIYNGFRTFLNYSDDDIYYICGKSEVDVDGDGVFDNVVDLTAPTVEGVKNAISVWARQRCKKGQTLYIWLVGHGAKYGTGARFEVYPDEYLDDLTLHNTLEIFGTNTNCNSYMITIESCFAGSFAAQLSKGRGRTIVMAERDNFAYYSNLGETSFSSLLMDRLTIPWPLKKSFEDVKMKMQNMAATRRQKPLLDVDGDGIPTLSELSFVADFYVGGFSRGYRVPRITEHTQGALVTGDEGSWPLYLRVDSLTEIQSAWVSVTPVDYDHEKLASVFTEGVTYEDPSEILRLYPSEDDPSYFTGEWRHSGLSGKYEVTFHVKDPNGYTATAGPITLRKGAVPFLSVSTDKSIYDKTESSSLHVSLGGVGTGIMYLLLKNPDGMWRAMEVFEGGIRLSSSINPSATTSAPPLLGDFVLFEFPKNVLFMLDHINMPAGDYIWVAALARADAPLAFSDLESYLEDGTTADSIMAIGTAAFYVNAGETDEKRMNSLAGTAGFAYNWYLEPYETDWLGWTELTTLPEQAEYAGLSGGAYTFHVKAKTESNELSEELARSFSIGSSGLVTNRVTGLSVRPSALSLYVGDTSQIQAWVAYDDEMKVDMTGSVKWSSSAANVVAVSDGEIRAVAPGKASIIAKISGFEAESVVTVVQSDISSGKTVGVVNINTPTVYLESSGQTAQLTAMAIYNDGIQQILDVDTVGVLWQSGDTNIAIVDSGGKVTAIENGTATVTCTYGNHSATATVIVDMPVLKEIRLEPSGQYSFSYTGQTMNVKVYAVYSKGDNQEVTTAAQLTSGNTGIVMAGSDGMLTATGEGTTKLTAIFAGFTATADVKVAFPNPKLSVSQTSFSFTGAMGGQTGGTSFQIKNDGTGSMTYELVNVTDWLSVTPASGSLAEGESAGIHLSYNPKSLGVNTYSAVITAKAMGAENSPQFLNITLTVVQDPNDVDADGDGYTKNQGECDDANASRNPGATEVCDDGIDNNCNQLTDEGCGPSAGDAFTETHTGMEFVWVEGGCYQMGCGDWDGDCYDNEKPVHEVCVDGFWMGKYEVTQGQWEQVMGSNPSSFGSCGSDCPVENVSWNVVQDFIAKLNTLTGNTYRLPREGEWEYAARSGGKEEKYAGCTDGSCLDTVVWYNGNSENTPHPVGTKSPNGLGIYDMSGNVWEWCQDWNGYYSSASVTNPTGPPSGSCRVRRGGGWCDSPKGVRVANRYYIYSDGGDNCIGFRLVRRK